jgi:hypothetical protein
MDEALERLIWQRAEYRCEYCQLGLGQLPLTFEIDHIIARQHGGPTRASNLALACFACNHHKGPNLAGLDIRTGRIVRLFHPRRHRWGRHFRWREAVLVGRTAIGRATLAVLAINQPDRVALRQALIDEGVFPPTL